MRELFPAGSDELDSELRALGDFEVLRDVEEAGRAECDCGFWADIPRWLVVARVTPFALDFASVGLQKTVEHNDRVLASAMVHNKYSAGIQLLKA
jgi:hypothetical protein